MPCWSMSCARAANSQALSHVAIVPEMGYLLTIGNGDSLTIRLVEELTQ